MEVCLPLGHNIDIVWSGDSCHYSGPEEWTWCWKGPPTDWRGWRGDAAGSAVEKGSVCGALEMETKKSEELNYSSLWTLNYQKRSFWYDNKELLSLNRSVAIQWGLWMLGNPWVITCPVLLHFYSSYKATSTSRSMSKAMGAMCCANPSQMKALYFTIYTLMTRTDGLQRIVSDWPDKKESFLSTWNTLDEIGHHGAEMSPDVLEDFCIFVILSFQEHPCQIHIFQEQSAQGQRVTFQSSVCALQLQRKWVDAIWEEITNQTVCNRNIWTEVIL